MVARLSLVLLIACGKSASDTAAPTTATQTPTFEQALADEGFIVQQGRLDVLPVEACCAWESCYRWNPTGEYGLFYLPMSPDENTADRELDATGMHWNWRLRSDEAVVFVGKTPPPTEYFSFRSYRHEVYDETLNGHAFGFLTLGGSLNNITTKYVGDDPYNADTMVITTADQQADEAIRRAAIRAGHNPDAINTDAIYTGDVIMGLDDKSDTFRMNHRISAYEDPADLAAWLAPDHSKVLRLTPITERSIISLPRATAPPAGSEIDVLQYQPALDELKAAIKADLGDVLTVYRESDNDVECSGACAGDATYGLLPDVFIPQGSGLYLIVFGFNHQVMGKIAFQNVVLHGQDNFDHIASTTAREWVGSARKYLPEHPDVDKLYAWTFAWDCAGRDHCTELREGCPGMTEGEPILVMFRNYLDPASGTHAQGSELLYSGSFLVVPTL